jgi:hypothetical protein
MQHAFSKKQIFETFQLIKFDTGIRSDLVRFDQPSESDRDAGDKIT